VTLRASLRDDAREHAIAFDVEALDEHGKLLQRLHKVELIGHRKLTAEERPAVLEEAHTAFVRMSGPEAEAYLADRDLKIDALLFTGEREALDRLLSDRRRAEWVAARVAAKVLVQRYLADFHGVAAALPNIEIAKDDNGAPHVRLHGDFPEIEVPHLTITHSSGVAIAALAGPGPRARLGIDLERVEVRDEAFAKNYFRDDELALRSGLTNGSALDRATFVSMLWAIKEAVSKALGLGLKLRLDDVQIAAVEHAAGEWRAEVALHGDAAERLAQLGGDALEIAIEMQGHFVLALARFRTDVDVTDQIDVVTPAPKKTSGVPAQPLHIAAVAAFLKHKGLAPNHSTKARTDMQPSDLPSWKN
jgi:phosphopantetheinyl transferase (holo-ACP synthase)